MNENGSMPNSGVAQSVTDQARLRIRLGETGAALSRLDEKTPGTAETLLALVRVIADEAARTPRFAKALTDVLAAPPEPAQSAQPAIRSAAAPAKKAPARRTKRAPAALDPFLVYREGGEVALRERLSPLSVDQLKDIIAEHAMDYDKLAMRWRTSSKLHDRIVQRVEALTTKGDAFR